MKKYLLLIIPLLILISCKNSEPADQDKGNDEKRDSNEIPHTPITPKYGNIQYLDSLKTNGGKSN